MSQIVDRVAKAKAMPALAEEREKLIFDIAWAMAEWSGDLKARAFDELPPYLQKMYLAGGEAIASALSAAGFSIVADGAFDAFELAKVDLARKPE